MPADHHKEVSLFDDIGDVETSNDKNSSVRGSQHAEYRGKGSTLGASFNFVNSIVGAGIIGMPIALKDCGMIMGIALILGIALLIDRSVIMLVECGIGSKKTNLEELVQHLFGKIGSNTCLLFMFLYAYGAMISYVTVVSDTIPMALDYFLGNSSPSKVVVTLVTASVLIFPLCLFRDVRKLSYTSMLSLLADTIMIIFVCAVGKKSAANQGTTFSYPDDVTVVAPNVFAGIGILSFAFVCQHNTFIVYKSMRNRNLQNWVSVSHLSLAVASAMCLTLGLAGYLSFGDHVQGDILNNFSTDDKLMIGARLLLALTMIFTYPMEMVVARHTVLSFYHGVFVPPAAEGEQPLLGIVSSDDDGGGSSHSQRSSNTARGSIVSTVSELPPHKPSLVNHFMITFALWVPSVAIALLVSDVRITLELTGALAASFLGYIMPAAIYFKFYSADWDQAIARFDSTSEHYQPEIVSRFGGLRKFVVPGFMMGFGFLAMFVGVGSVIYGLVYD
jgi:solute carrier family 38 (sodium-coupled neutral amino acid transporter), member 11